jgi:hypothetical protein
MTVSCLWHGHLQSAGFLYHGSYWTGSSVGRAQD